MKKLLFIVSIVSILISCDNGAMTANEKINPFVGTWRSNGIPATDSFWIDAFIVFTETEYNSQYVWLVKSEGFVGSIINRVEKGTYAYDDKTVEFFRDTIKTVKGEDPSIPAEPPAGAAPAPPAYRKVRYKFEDAKLYIDDAPRFGYEVPFAEYTPNPE